MKPIALSLPPFPVQSPTVYYLRITVGGTVAFYVMAEYKQFIVTRVVLMPLF
ncbi:hypothetical protein KN1_12640 [Stygiolobus caldivivus]|uniref:Uncharacterized protein n=1 Tax=Stygiolobus caldivivus TaxID=2824673 RepID=A0A8D5U6M8_9CREN|nr:hypothetical protein KN1_12640 [Stygiolobus caldivivus]